MKWIACLVVAAACQRSTGEAPSVPPDYRLDIERLCDVMARSGADQLPDGDRTVVSSQWLTKNLTTPAVHDFLVRIQPLEGDPKAQALLDEARRVGLATCPLAAEWRAPPR
jgi:hypothetical protein